MAAELNARELKVRLISLNNTTLGIVGPWNANEEFYAKCSKVLTCGIKKASGCCKLLVPGSTLYTAVASSLTSWR